LGITAKLAANRFFWGKSHGFLTLRSRFLHPDMGNCFNNRNQDVDFPYTQPPRRFMDRLIVFTRYPLPGQTKTRLIPTLGEIGAADLQTQMTERTVDILTRVTSQLPVDIEIRFAGGSLRQMRRWLGNQFSYRPQGNGDLGDRMARAFQTAFREGYQRVIAVGIDCPHLSDRDIIHTWENLQNSDLVLGPAWDGGYYLIGLRQFYPQLFQGITWGSEFVRQETLDIADNSNLSYHLLSPKGDIDRPEDLHLWEDALTQEKISVIIPMLNEADTITATLANAQTGENVEILVVDSGSEDGSVAKAEDLGVRAIKSDRGKAKQMNAGARAATGDILLFLHADTLLPPGYDRWIRRTVRKPNFAVGAFELAIGWEESDRTRQTGFPQLRWVEWGVKWRSHWLQLPYGDQALFFKSDRFQDLGGFPEELPIMEDFVFVRRLRKLGKAYIVPESVRTSARRWQRLGVLRTTAINQVMILGYFLGISPTKLAHWYRKR
jgi:hypothetical protein